MSTGWTTLRGKCCRGDELSSLEERVKELEEKQNKKQGQGTKMAELKKEIEELKKRHKAIGTKLKTMTNDKW